jgi:hypothetical protein
MVLGGALTKHPDTDYNLSKPGGHSHEEEQPIPILGSRTYLLNCKTSKILVNQKADL